MRSKMAAPEVRHERFTPDGPKKKKHMRVFQHVAMSDTDTVACSHTNTHRERFYLSTDLLSLCVSVCVCLGPRRNWA